MNANLWNSILLGLMYLVLYIAAFSNGKKNSFKAGIDLQIIKAGTGIITLLFPFLLNTIFPVFILCFFFGLIFYISTKAKLFTSDNELEVSASEGLFYIASVLMCFIFYKVNNNLLCFYLPVLILVMGQPLTTLVGKHWPIGRFIIRYNSKSVSGTFAFFIAAMFISSFLLFHMTSLNGDVILRKTLILSTGATIAQALSIKGIDNLAIPLFVLWILKIQI
jgi:phytol kinase